MLGSGTCDAGQELDARPLRVSGLGSGLVENDAAIEPLASELQQVRSFARNIPTLRAANDEVEIGRVVECGGDVCADTHPDDRPGAVPSDGVDGTG